jgi:formamidopyrimidine-DNA glycosylase
MPELPDLEHLVAQLREQVIGSTIVKARVRDPLVLRIALEGDLNSHVRGQKLREVRRRGAFLELEVGAELKLVLHLMLAGRLKVAPVGERDEAALCFALDLGGRELRFIDDKRMGKAYLIRHGDDAQVPGLATLGVDVMTPAFTLEHFRSIAAKRRDQVRAFVMDKTAISAIGNAYADEILFEAKIHPKTWVRQLSPAQVEDLYRAIGSVLRDAIQEVASRGAPMQEKVRDFLKVRGHAGEACPRCGAKIRTIRVLDGDACFCPTCQPATRSLFIDWQRAPKVAPAADPSAPPRLEPQKKPRRKRRS